jgi:hypothetical protein
MWCTMVHTVYTQHKFKHLNIGVKWILQYEEQY